MPKFLIYCDSKLQDKRDFQAKSRKKEKRNKVLDFVKLEYLKKVLDFHNIEYYITFLIDQILG